MRKRRVSVRLPRRPRDPTGTDALERRAFREFGARMRRVARVYRDLLDRLPRELAVNARYAYLLDGTTLTEWLSGAAIAVEDILLEGGPDNLWFFDGYVETAYARGMQQEHANIAAQSPAYRAGSGSAAEILASEPYRRRLSMIRAREFEEMKGLAATVVADMSRVLVDGLARGRGPRDIARDLNETAGIDARRAERIARTEINTALRRSRLDEADDAQERYGVESKQMHFSALSPTTRATHAARHGKLYTTDEQRDWWSVDANSINCKCSTITVMVDSDGEPLDGAVLRRARKMLREYES